MTLFQKRDRYCLSIRNQGINVSVCLDFLQGANLYCTESTERKISLHSVLVGHQFSKYFCYYKKIDFNWRKNDMQLVDIKHSRVTKCAFCRYWYDPTNSALIAKNPAAGFWEYDQQMRKRCSMMNAETAGCQTCGKFEMKML